MVENLPRMNYNMSCVVIDIGTHGASVEFKNQHFQNSIQMKIPNRQIILEHKFIIDFLVLNKKKTILKNLLNLNHQSRQSTFQKL